MTLPVFAVADLPESRETTLEGPEGKHAATVRRLRPSETLLLSDGRGGLARCAVVEVAKESLRLEVVESWHVPPPRLRVCLVQALIKGDRGELAVELATEAGVDRVVPWRASRCIAKWDEGARGAKALARWRNAADQARKQARRAWSPEVTEPVSTSRLTELVSGSGTTLVLHEVATTPLSAVELPHEGEVTLVVGPEGGITDAELAGLTDAGAQPVHLGSAVLRASTAATVALGALGALTDRW